MRFSSRSKGRTVLLFIALVVFTSAIIVVGALHTRATHASGGSPFINGFNTITTLSSTVPKNGDVNPYGTFVVPRSSGKLVKGNVLVSNFNNKANLQGTGTTIVQISPSGKR